MRNWIALFENRARDAAYDRFWWSEDDGFEDVNDTSHADFAMGHFSDMATGDYDDVINSIEDEDDANRAYMERGSVRGGYLATNGTGYFAAETPKLIQQCLLAMAADGRPVMAISYECGNQSGELQGAELETFIRTGRIPRKRVAESMSVETLKKAMPWTPTSEQLLAATDVASAFYEAGQEDDYSFDQFFQDIEMGRSTIANDNALDLVASLTYEMLVLLHAYGEETDWRGLTPAGYKAWASR